MRFAKVLTISLICICLTACVSSLLIGNQAQSKLMWALLKPLVGFDPNEVNLFESPMIKNRMTKLLGDKYEPTMKLLRTAQEIQKEGALFYVASRYAPPKFQEVTDKAAMVWNADTNQMAVMLITDGNPEIISEQVDKAKQSITPVLPKEVQTAYDKAVEKKKELDNLKDQINKLQNLEQLPEKALEELKSSSTEKAQEEIDEAINSTGIPTIP
jgi:hypothetical protein